VLGNNALQVGKGDKGLLGGHRVLSLLSSPGLARLHGWAREDKSLGKKDAIVAYLIEILARGIVFHLANAIQVEYIRTANHRWRVKRFRLSDIILLQECAPTPYARGFA
jgi:hypothetical protein